MAGCNFSFDDDFMNMLNKLENTDEIAKKILKECAPLIVEREKKELQSKIGKSKRITGSLVNSIKMTAVKKNDYGHYVVVRPTGKDKKGVRNMEKFIYGEYGTSQQQAEPIQQRVIQITDNEIAEKAQEIFNQEVGL